MSKYRVVGLFVLLPALGCGENGAGDIAVETTQEALTSTDSYFYEAENLSRTASTAGSQVTSEGAASAGKYVQFLGTPAVGEWIEFTLPGVPAGTYDVRMLYKANYNRGIVQASIDGVAQGAGCDQYSANATFQVTCGLGVKTLTAGNHTIRFTVTDKNPSSAGYAMVVDQVSLVSRAATGWVGTWTTAQQLTETANLPPASLTNSTLRQVVRVSLGGTQIRVRYSNEYGNSALTIKAARVAVCRSNPVDSTIDTTTGKAVLFGGSAGVTIPAGKVVWSDLVTFTLGARSNLSITTAFGSTPTNVTGHPASRTTSYIRTNSSNVSESSMSTALKTDHWYYASAVDVKSTVGRAIAILGDSITDGRGSTTNGNNRWPDRLAVRLHANAATVNDAVLNAGIGGNALVSGGLGPTGMNRFDRDMLGQSAVQWIVVFEGVNDIGGNQTAAAITSAYDTLIAKAHANNLLIYGATITPFGTNSYYSAAHESVRQSVNSYIRSGKFDAYFDFDAAVRDGSNPPRLQTVYDSGDGLHLNPTGYQKLADTVNLARFQ